MLDHPLAQLAADEATGKLPEGSDVGELTSDPVQWRMALLSSVERTNAELAGFAAEEAELRSEIREPGRFHQALASIARRRAATLRFKASIDTRLRHVKTLFTEDDKALELRAVAKDLNGWRRACVWLVDQMEDITDLVADAPEACRRFVEEAANLVEMLNDREAA